MQDPAQAQGAAAPPAGADADRDAVIAELRRQLDALHAMPIEQIIRARVQLEKDAALDAAIAEDRVQAEIVRSRAAAEQDRRDEEFRLTQESIARTHANTTRSQGGQLMTSGCI